MASNKSESDGGNLGDQNNPGSCFATPKQQQQPRRPVPVRVASDDDDDDDDYDANSGRRIGLDEPEATNVDGGGGRRRRRAKKRIRSLYGVSPDCRFGPKGTILDSSCKFLSIPDPTGQKLEWHNPPLSVLIVRKISDNALLSPFRDVLNWLILKKNMIVFVEDNVLEDFSLLPKEEFQDIRNKLHTFREEKDDLTDKIDFIICLGGDGTLLHASSLFQRSMPPVMSFHLGSLGFLAPFQFSNFQEQITQVLEGNAALLLRSRLKCVLCRKDSEHLKVPHVKNIDYQKESACNHILVLNEVVMDRGPSPYLCNIDLYVEGRIVTSVQGDGVIISTPTGSTAYAVAAGASIMHPNVPAIMITPICPHSLSFRPIVVPAGVEIKLMVSPEARNSAWVSFDGRNRQELKIGDCVRITTAIHPLPSLCMKDPIDDWFESLAECLHWNLRKPQQMLSSVSSLTSVESVDLDAVS